MLIITLATILVFSSQSGNQSNGISNRIANKIEIFLDAQGNNSYNAEDINFVIRKLAHFTEYLILTILLIVCCSYFLRRVLLTLLISSIVGVSLAFIDEYFQRSSGGRTSSLFDIMIDSFGVLIGIIIGGVFMVYFKQILLNENKVDDFKK
jgi:VanZ family protein